MWVSGTKPGRIAYIGETQFAAGEWAGVVLDDAVGKNDGSVNGVRYFQCEAKRGVFSRVLKLSHVPIQPGSGGHSHAASASVAHTALKSLTQQQHNGAASDRGDVTCISSDAPGNALKMGQTVETPPSFPSQYDFKVGERVIVSGSKQGVLRFIGTTEFAPGDWAGVELDDAQGKNDGTVAGRR